MGTETLGTHPDLAVGGSLLVSFITSFSKQVKMSKPLSSRSHSSKLIKPQEGVVGTSDLLSYQTGALGHL